VSTDTARGLTTRDVSRRLLVSEDKVRRWIANGELRAINTANALCGRPRYVITQEALAEFERCRTVGPPPKPPRRKRKPSDCVDYFPGD
jgi:excisionase family DNA binding protein